MAILGVLGLAAAASAQAQVLHKELQAVTATGTTAWAGSHPFAMRGVILNDPEEMLDMAWNPDAVATTNLGGQYQIFIQSAEPGDFGGTALWMGQNYQARGMLGEYYDEAAWASELARLMIATNGRAFRKGDLVEVTARNSLTFGGKRNINEGHLADPDCDFDLTLVRANAGVPPPVPLRLADLVNADGSARFDATRATGGERWQGERVRLDGIRLADTNGWGKTLWGQRVCWAVDDTGRSFRLRMPLTDLGSAISTATYVSAVGILNQESGGPVGTNGYELFVQEIRPVELEIGPGVSGGAAVRYSADYEGYVVEYSDDGLGTWATLDAMPKRMMVVDDEAASTSRVYRLKWAP
jgi:hypothetical protein